MLDIGFSEILLTSVIALVVLGPERLPKVARQIGNWVGRARIMARQLNEQLEREVSAADLERVVAKPTRSAAPPASPAATPAPAETSPAPPTAAPAATAEASAAAAPATAPADPLSSHDD